MYHKLDLKNETVVNEAHFAHIEDGIAAIHDFVKVSPKMVHFSFDDTISSLRDLTVNASNYKSVFDQPFFADLKTLHDSYGAVFSCYCFNQILNSADSAIVDFSLADVTDVYAAEFSANSDWLRFGFHSINGSTNYREKTAEEAKNDYDYFITQIIRITGSVACLDMVVRLQNFAGSLEACRGMRDCACGIIGFLTGDYSESGNGGNVSYDDYTTSGYYLDATTAKTLARKGRYFDANEQLFFYPSNLRLDGITSANIADYMAKFLTADRYARSNMLIMYCHEDQMFRAVGINADYKKRMAGVCTWAIDNGYTFGFPMDKIWQTY